MVIQKDLIAFLEARKWLVERTHGNLYQDGFPDLYIACSQWGTRWIDCKNPARYCFTKAQRRKWPVWEQNGIGIWILVAASQRNTTSCSNRLTGGATGKIRMATSGTLMLCSTS